MRGALSTISHLLTGDHAVRSLLGLLLVSDLLFLVLNFIPAPASLDRGQLLLERDQSFSEIFQYLKSFWIALLFLALVLRRRYAGYLVWAILFLYFMLDDMLAFHEWFGYQWRLRQGGVGSGAQEVGELIGILLVIVPALILVGLAHWWGDRAYRVATLPLFVLVVAMAFFGIGVDKVHGMIEASEAVHIFLGTVEDWGEMVAVSVVLAYTFALHLSRGTVGSEGMPLR